MMLFTFVNCDMLYQSVTKRHFFRLNFCYSLMLLNSEMAFYLIFDLLVPRVSSYEQDLELYKNRITESVKLCKDRIYDCTNTDDPHAIR